MQHLSQILSYTKRSSWAFSIAADGSTHYGKSYLDNRIRVHINGKLYNIHALAIPMFEKHTGENMFLLVSQFFDVICPRWRTQLLGIGSDGAAAMTGHLKGFATRIAAESGNNIYRVWCGLHQLDLVMKHAYKALYNNEVVLIMKRFIQHLRIQQTLIAQMEATCPQLTTRWLQMGTTSTWLLKKRVELFEHLSSADPPIASAPPDWWWIVIFGISALTDIINPVFTKLQAPNLLVSTQATILEGLAIDICAAVGIDGPFDSETLARVNREFYCTFGRWSVSYCRVRTFLENLGMYPRQTLPQLDFQLCRKVLMSMGQLATGLVEGVVNIQAERNALNHASDDLPAVLPHQLVKLSTANYGNTVVDKHLQQLRSSWSENNISEIENQHRLLRMAYQSEPALKAALDDYAECDLATFDGGWAIVAGRFEVLRDFCGGIATVFPNTASVESDFSILGWDKDDHRMSLTDISLEGILQCKQYQLISDLVS
jgi:hypothetical protein